MNKFLVLTVPSSARSLCSPFDDKKIIPSELRPFQITSVTDKAKTGQRSGKRVIACVKQGKLCFSCYHPMKVIEGYCVDCFLLRKWLYFSNNRDARKVWQTRNNGTPRTNTHLAKRVWRTHKFCGYQNICCGIGFRLSVLRLGWDYF